MNLAGILGIIASIVAIIGGGLAIVSWIKKSMKDKEAVIIAYKEGNFPSQHVAIFNNGSHVAKDLEVKITGCCAHDCPRQDLNPDESIEILIAIDKDTREVCVDCSWTDGRKGRQNFHRVMYSR